MKRRTFNSLAAAALLPAAAMARANSLGTRPIRLLLPYSAGGPTDAIARAVARKLEADLQLSVVVENKPGAQGILATQALLQAPPDGHTIGWTPSPVLTTNRLVLPTLPYKLQELKLLTPLYRGGMVFAVSPSSKSASLREYLDEVKGSGQAMIYGTAGPGGNSHLTVELLAHTAGLKTQMVPYKGDGPMTLDLAGGNLPAMIAAVGSTQQHHQRGAIKLLAFSGKQRMKELPQVPTLIESGFPIESYFWAGATLRAGVPEPIAERLRGAFESAMHSEEVRAAMTSDLVPHTGSEAMFQQMVDDEFQRWSQLVKARGMQFK